MILQIMNKLHIFHCEKCIIFFVVLFGPNRIISWKLYVLCQVNENLFYALGDLWGTYQLREERSSPTLIFIRHPDDVEGRVHQQYLLHWPPDHQLHARAAPHGPGALDPQQPGAERGRQWTAYTLPGLGEEQGGRDGPGD